MKKIILLSAVVAFLSVNINVQAAVDCSNYKTFSHKWNMCKIGKLPGVVSSGGSETETTKKKGSGSIKNFLNKIRTFGGENRGSEG
mgnify:CR=1 FL=1